MDLGSLLSGPIGALFGGISAIGTKVIDLKMKKLDHEHELSMRDKDRQLAELEMAHKSEMQKSEADQQINLKELDTFAASFGNDKATYGDSLTGRIVDLARGLVRPVITMAASYLVGHMTIVVLQNGADLTPALRMELLRESMFLAGTSIGWWFGTRPNRIGGKK